MRKIWGGDGERMFRARGGDDGALAMLRHTEICGVENLREKGVAETAQAIGPWRVKVPVQKLRNVLNDDERRAMNLCARHDCPGGRAGLFVARTIVPARAGVA